MKTVLRSGLFMALVVTGFTRLSAQCDASSILIQNIQQVGVQTPGSCSVKFDLSFQMQNNGGNKFIFIHGWKEDVYPDFFDCVDGKPSANGAIRPPEADDLDNTFINIGINNTGDTAALLTNYTPDPTLVLSTADSVVRTELPNGDAFFVIYGVTAVFPAPCNDAFLIAFDFWSSQAAQAQSAQCVNCHVLYPVNYIDVGGFANCANLSFGGTITNKSTAAVTGYTLVYADVNGDGFLGEGVDVLIQDTTTFSIAAGPGTTTSISGTIPPVNINLDILVLTSLNIAGSEAAAQVNLLLSTQCGALPVTFKSFWAQRTSRTNVSLRWETATEINNRGFALQRNLGNGIWEQVVFINSQDIDGNSDVPLTYSYNDLNTHRGISQYRIKQVDYDGRARFSEVRAVRGEGQSAETIVYPVPSKDGRVNVVFADAETNRDVTLIDMTGRAIRQWKNLAGNTLQIENLRVGIYTLRILDKATGNVSAEKIIISSN